MELIKKVYKKLGKNEDNIEGITISGGEPFLRKDLREICKYIKKQ